MNSLHCHLRLDKLSKKDRREVRNFERFLKLKPKYLKRMLTRHRWQVYLGLTKEEAQAMWRSLK